MTTIGNPGSGQQGPKLVWDTPGVIGPGQSIGKFVCNTTLVLPTNCPYSVGNMGAAPTNAWAASLDYNGSTIGTITISAAGTLASFSSTTQTLTTGGVLEAFAPGTQDPTAADLALTLQLFNP